MASLVHNNFTYKFSRCLQGALPRTWFCWLSRSASRFQNFLRPKKWSYWTQIADEIYLGAIPLKNCHHQHKIAKLGVKTVVAINKKHEFKKLLCSDPVKAHDWEKKNIAFLKVSCKDLRPLPVEELAKTVDYVVNRTKLGPVYIHCTGGRGRSVTVALCCLIEIKGYSLKQAIKHVKRCRPQLNISRDQMNNVNAWYTREK